MFMLPRDLLQDEGEDCDPGTSSSVDVALRPRAGAQGLNSGRHGGAGEDGSRSADEGRRDGQEPAAGRYGRRPCGAVIGAGSRRA